MAKEWDIEPGTRIRRRLLHDLYGGGRQGGMEPSARTPNVFLFTDETEGGKYGYNFDGWHPDGTFHYTGEGQIGDQVMSHGNRAVRDHREENRALRLFAKDGTDVLYVGEFEIPDESYVLEDEALDVNREGLRSVFVFRLRPVGSHWMGLNKRAPAATLPHTVPIEAHNVEAYARNRMLSEPVEGLRLEAELVARYIQWLRIKGAEVERQAIPTSAGHLMYTDIYVRGSRELIEAKSSSSREHIRLALGQILDYARYVDHSSLAVLTPTRPEGELISLLIAHGIGIIWEAPQRGQFKSERPVDAWHDALG